MSYRDDATVRSLSLTARTPLADIGNRTPLAGLVSTSRNRSLSQAQKIIYGKSINYLMFTNNTKNDGGRVVVRAMLPPYDGKA